ncbi:MAG: sigma-70 family RNA polymerase sigma factor [Glaciimonas sp.]|nr:sigma-70 family RNA polymerase sigma factor [Glaciimonas sp.]
MNCLITAWSLYAPEIRSWLRHRLGATTDVEDVLQDLFLKALRQGDRFCSVHNARAWLFEVARNMLADRLRVARETVVLPEDIPAPAFESETVDNLTACLYRVLSELSAEDCDAIMLCDIQAMSHAEYAQRKDLSLSATKSRLQRARKRLREQMTSACQLQFDEFGRVSDFVPRDTPLS